MAGLMVCCSASDGVGGSGAPLCAPGCAPRVRRPQCAGRCLLAALDDLQCRPSAAPRPSRDAFNPSSEGREAVPRASRLPQQHHHLLLLRPHLDDTTSESSYDSASDYHLYEEILYEAAASPKPLEAIPPPLPARPPHLFRSVLVQHPQESQQQQQQQQVRPQQPLPPQRRQPTEVQTTQQPQQTPPHGQPPTDSPQTPPSHPQQPQPQSSQCRTKPTPPPKPPKPQRAVQTPEGKPVAPPLKHTVNPPSTPLTNATKNLTTSSSKVGPQPPKGSATQAGQQQQQQQQQQEGGEASGPLKPTINKPKQRSNLYSIFRDRDHRRCLSASLQQEYQKDLQQDQAGAAAATVAASSSCASLAGAEDDYGFKVVPHVV